MVTICPHHFHLTHFRVYLSSVVTKYCLSSSAAHIITRNNIYRYFKLSLTSPCRTFKHHSIRNAFNSAQPVKEDDIIENNRHSVPLSRHIRRRELKHKFSHCLKRKRRKICKADSSSRYKDKCTPISTSTIELPNSSSSGINPLLYNENKVKDILTTINENKVRYTMDDVKWTKVKTPTVGQILSKYMQLSKIRLTGLVVVTSAAGYIIAPGAFDLLTFSMCCIGTGLTSACANTLNQFIEVPFDSQMKRTKNRVLVTEGLSPLHAVLFAMTSGVAGVMLLLQGVNPLTASLGLFNLITYTTIYTPLKRVSVTNTWVGSIVGAVPPVMGWTACTGGLDSGALLLAGIMYSWQFVHFNSLSWNLRHDYSRSGYRMMSSINPDLCKRVAFRYTFVLTGLCLSAPLLSITTWTFVLDTLPLNLYNIYLGWRFWRRADSKSSRKLFHYSLIYIPALFTLMFISKKR